MVAEGEGSEHASLGGFRTDIHFIRLEIHVVGRERESFAGANSGVEGKVSENVRGLRPSAVLKMMK